MTAEELRQKFYKFRLGEWPKYYEVDAETYANCCQDVFDNTAVKDWANIITQKNILWRTLALGPNNGLMFKGVELILKKDGKT